MSFKLIDNNENSEASEPQRLKTKPVSSETIDLVGLFSTDMSISGSFDLRSFRITSVAKLLEILPLPVFLVNVNGEISFINKAALTLMKANSNQEGKSLRNLFHDQSQAENIDQLLEKVLKTRIPIISTLKLTLGNEDFNLRMHLRSVRIGKERFVLVILERI